jgi:heme exporter protein A
VAENLVFYARLHGVAPGRGADLLEAVGMAAKRDALVHTLSRGETQRVSLARALLHDPDVLLADEPFSGLDHAAAASLPALLRREGRTLVVASHDPVQAMAVCDRAVTLERGRIVPDEAPPPAPRQSEERPAGRGAAGRP